jgi:hypothetical protein
MLINQLLTLRAAQIVLHVTLGHHLNQLRIIQSVKMNWPGRLGRAAPFNT